MDPFILVITSGLASLLAILAHFIFNTVYKPGSRSEPVVKTYTERLTDLTERLRESSRAIDGVLLEVAEVAQDRAQSVARLEVDLQSLKERQQEIRDTMASLEQTPIPAAEYFATLLDARETRNAKRDYLLFAAGVVLTTIVTIGLQFFF